MRHGFDERAKSLLGCFGSLDDDGQAHARVDRAEDVVGARGREWADGGGIVVDLHVADRRCSLFRTRKSVLVGVPHTFGEGMRHRRITYQRERIALMERDDIR